MHKLNKTIAKFSYKGKAYEVDRLLDADREGGIRTFHLYSKDGDFLHEFEHRTNNKNGLIRKAKEDIRNYGISY